MKVAIVGAGQIARSYAADLASYDELDLVAIADLVPQRAHDLGNAFGARAHSSLEELLAGEAELIVNTTTFAAHGEVTRQCLAAGKHVYTEKPLAASPKQARELVRLADAHGVRLGCAPCNLLGEAQQTAWRLLREGVIGTVRTVHAEAHGGRIESWHPAPEPFFAAGPMADLAIYPLTLLTAILGPVRRVAANARVLREHRATVDGSVFPVTTPDFIVAVLTLADDTLVRLTTSFDLPRQQPGAANIEFHGDKGRLLLEDWQRFTARVSVAAFEGPLAPVSDAQVAEKEVENGRGVRELAAAIREQRPHRGGAEQGAHLVDVLAATARSVSFGRPIDIDSGFPPPHPMPYERPRSGAEQRPEAATPNMPRSAR